MNPKKIIASILLLLITVCIVTVRHQTTTGDSGSAWGDLSRAGLFTVMTIIPAFISERLLRKIREILPNHRTAHHLDGSITITSKERQRALLQYQEITTAQKALEHERDRRRAIYDQAYRQAKARLGQPTISDNT